MVSVRTRGQAAVISSNKRQLGQSLMHRYPAIPVKIAVVKNLDDAVWIGGNPQTVPASVRRELEEFNGFS